MPSAFADSGLFLSGVLDITHILLSPNCGAQDSASYFYHIIVCRVIRQNRSVCYEINPLAPYRCMQLTPANCRRWQMQINYYNTIISYTAEIIRTWFRAVNLISARVRPNWSNKQGPQNNLRQQMNINIYISVNISFNSLPYRMALVPAHSCSSVNNNSKLWRRLWPNRKSYAYSNVIYI